MARKIICGLPNRKGNENETCEGVVAHQVSQRMVQIGRQDGQRFTIVGSDWSVTATCPVCGRVHSVICRDGKIDESELKYKEEAPADPPQDPETPPAGDPPAPEGEEGGE